MNNPKIILISGANTGIGKETARQLAFRGHQVIMVCRDKGKGEKAKEEIIAETGNPLTDLLIADFSSFMRIHELSATIHKTYPRLDVLINNAGIFVTRKKYTADGYELQWGVNHLSHFLFTRLLLGHLRQAGSARIITVSSVANYRGEIHFDDPGLGKRYNGLAAYRQSKLANVLFTLELAERLKGTGITANCLHPGLVRTTIGHRNNWHWMGLAWWLMKPRMISIEEGATMVVKLAVDTAYEGITGKYFHRDGNERDPNPVAYDRELRKRFWQLSEEQAHLETLSCPGK